MQHVVEVAHLVNGDLVSVRHLSARRERMGAWAAAVTVCLACLATMAATAIGARVMGRALYAPGFGGLWVATALAVSGLAVVGVRHRLRRYALGSRLDADAFAPVDVDLVRRVGDRFELTVIPGMSGRVEGGRAPLPVEALQADGPRTMILDRGARAELSLGSSTFVVHGQPSPCGPRAVCGALSRDLFKLFSRPLGIGLQVAVLGSLFCVVSGGQTIGDRPGHLVGARATTPWEAEKWLRIEAQAQARSLHQCFDRLPLGCQHSGYVGVGVSLTRDGEVRSNWIARSTYGSDCPVAACMKDVVATWVFDPLPESMRVVLPVQVLRTDKPLPTKVAEAQIGTVGDSRGR